MACAHALRVPSRTVTIVTCVGVQTWVVPWGCVASDSAARSCGSGLDCRCISRTGCTSSHNTFQHSRAASRPRHDSRTVHHLWFHRPWPPFHAALIASGNKRREASTEVCGRVRAEHFIAVAADGSQSTPRADSSLPCGHGARGRVSGSTHLQLTCADLEEDIFTSNTSRPSLFIDLVLAVHGKNCNVRLKKDAGPRLGPVIHK